MKNYGRLIGPSEQNLLENICQNSKDQDASEGSNDAPGMHRDYASKDCERCHLDASDAMTTVLEDGVRRKVRRQNGLNELVSLVQGGAAAARARIVAG